MTRLNFIGRATRFQFWHQHRVQLLFTNCYLPKKLITPHSLSQQRRFGIRYLQYRNLVLLVGLSMSPQKNHESDRHTSSQVPKNMVQIAAGEFDENDAVTSVSNTLNYPSARFLSLKLLGENKKLLEGQVCSDRHWSNFFGFWSHKRKRIWILLFGQLISVALAGTGIASTTLSRDCGVSVPTAQSAFVYFMLSLHLLVLRKRQQRRKQEAPASPVQQTSSDKNFFGIQLHVSWWVYLLIAILDLEANFLTVLAYRYTSFTSIMLLESIAVPSSMISSMKLLQMTYSRHHLLGVGICLLGLIATIDSDDMNRAHAGVAMHN